MNEYLEIFIFFSTFTAKSGIFRDIQIGNQSISHVFVCVILSYYGMFLRKQITSFSSMACTKCN